MKPIAAPIVGGMITSTIHVLILVPVFFAMIRGPRDPPWTGPRHRFERSGK
jgi:Cu/Ag efflux pump CusA